MTRVAYMLVVGVALTGCGRIGFDALTAGTGSGSGPISPTGHPIAIATGDSFACALRGDGGVWCWGDDGAGQLGVGGGVPRALPVNVPAITDAIALDAGAQHACVVRSDGSVWCAGDNTHGQLGSHGTASQNAFVAVVGLPAAAVAIAAGVAHTCALLVDGTAWCWGANESGEVGIDSGGADVPTPTRALADVAQLACGRAQTCAVRTDQSVACWGADDAGQLGDGMTTNRAAPQTIAGLSALAITTADHDTCALVASDNYACWGTSQDGELGLGGSVSVTRTPMLGARGLGLIAIATGFSHTCALNADGAALCWGHGYDGATGLGDTYGQSTPMPAAASGLVAIDAGTYFTCGIRLDGSATCWGRGRSGQLGNGMISVWTPQQVTLPAPATAIAAGGTHSCAIAGGTVYCWGDDDNGELGLAIGSGAASAIPVSVALGDAASTLALGAVESCAITADGQLSCWGANYAGQLGVGDTQSYVGAQRVVANSTAIAAGAEAVLTVVASTVEGWGDDTYGELADGGSAGSATPKPLAMVPASTEVAVGDAYACAIATDASLWCWGLDYTGQIGDGVAHEIALPTKIGTGYQEVTTGDKHTCAIAANVLLCWGANDNGELGNGTFVQRGTPGTTQLAAPVAQVSAGTSFTCAATLAGGDECWGANSFGQLGNASASSTAAPGDVVTSVPFTQLATGASHACGLTAAGDVYCWGDNTRGEVGIGTYCREMTPGAVTFSE